jgi:phage anti-repressor protein
METTKQRLIRKLQQLPNEILDAPELYFLDLIELKGQMQYNSWIADRYKKYRELTHNEDFLRFKLGNWSIIMETWGD